MLTNVIELQGKNFAGDGRSFYSLSRSDFGSWRLSRSWICDTLWDFITDLLAPLSPRHNHTFPFLIYLHSSCLTVFVDCSSFSGHQGILGRVNIHKILRIIPFTQFSIACMLIVDGFMSGICYVFFPTTWATKKYDIYSSIIVKDNTFLSFNSVFFGFMSVVDGFILYCRNCYKMSCIL